jgi:hypothetical protein
MIAVPATLALGCRFDIQTTVATAVLGAAWEVAALVRPLLALPLPALALAALNESVLPMLAAITAAD